MTHLEELLDTLRRSYDGPAWHGPSLKEALADVTAEEALFKPSPKAHSIWELTLHIAAWGGEVAARLNGGEPKQPAEGDWPPVGSELDNDGWEDAYNRVFHVRDVVLKATSSQSESDLQRRVGNAENPQLATGFTRAGMIEGLAQHNVYHAGQIMLLKRLIQ